MNYLLIGCYYPEELENRLSRTSRSGSLDYAANNLQKAIIKGFDENTTRLKVINAPIVGSFPPYSRSAFIPSYKNGDVDSISYLNISFIKNWIIGYKLLNRIKRWSELTAHPKTIIFYSYTAFSIINLVKEIDQKIRVVLMVTDLPQYMSADNFFLTRLRRYLTKPFRRDKSSTYSSVDGYILLASEMRDRIPVGAKPWIQIEGIYNDDVICNSVVEPIVKSNKTILYTGNLGLKYGIDTLLEAFSLIKDATYRLYFCGAGDGLERILDCSTRDHRICYLGVKNRAEVLRLQRSATILINPRSSRDDYTRFSFPSKTMEYLASGTPVVMSRLTSIPNEYDKYIYFVEDESANGFKNKIVEVCSLPPDVLKMRGEQASRFIMERKSPKTQVRRIIDFIENLA